MHVHFIKIYLLCESLIILKCDEILLKTNLETCYDFVHWVMMLNKQNPSLMIAIKIIRPIQIQVIEVEVENMTLMRTVIQLWIL